VNPKGTHPPAIVVGLDELTGIQTARLLSQRGVEVIGVAKRPTEYACKTRHVRRVIKANTYSDEIVPALVELGKSLGKKAVLVPCIDESVLQISRRRAELDPYFLYALPTAEVVETLTDKERFFRFALQEKLPIPKTFLISNRKEALEAADGLRYPCVLKPSLKSAHWWAIVAKKAIIIDSREEFIATYDRVGDLTKVLIA